MRHTKGSSTLANDPKLCVVLFYLWLGTAKRNQKHQKNRTEITSFLLTWSCFPMAAFDLQVFFVAAAKKLKTPSREAYRLTRQRADDPMAKFLWVTFAHNSLTYSPGCCSSHFVGGAWRRSLRPRKNRQKNHGGGRCFLGGYGGGCEGGKKTW